MADMSIYQRLRMHFRLQRVIADEKALRKGTRKYPTSEAAHQAAAAVKEIAENPLFSQHECDAILDFINVMDIEINKMEGENNG
jgi:hypothetical protein